MKYDLNRKVGAESSRTYKQKIRSGFFDKYMQGKGIEPGFAGYQEGTVSILEGCLGVDLNYPNYDGINLPFQDEEFDYLYSSHCLEHVKDINQVLKEWYRVVKTDGYLVIITPHQYLYERRINKPSKWNGDHNYFFSPGKLLTHIEEALEPNSYRVRLLEDGDENYNYSVPLSSHPDGQYEITTVLQKIKKPDWNLE